MSEMGGKVVVITGATSGIGEEAAVELSRRGATVVVHGRSPAKIEATLARIQAEAGVAAESVQADLSSMAEIRRACAELRERHPVIDVLLNNAGAVFQTRAVTVDGFEQTFAVNHVAYYLMAAELLPSLLAATAGRIVSVASDAHRGPGLAWDDLQSERMYVGFKTYGQSKLMNILFTRELARKLEGTTVTTNCVHPGVVATGFALNESGIVKAFWKLAQPFIRSPARGAATSIFLCCEPDVGSGGYFANSKPKKPSGAARNDADAARLWAITEELTGTPWPN